MKRLMLALITLCASCCNACAGQTTVDAKVRSALDAFALVVDPAYSFAIDACTSKESQIADEVEAGRLKPDEAVIALKPIRARCHTIRDTFESIRVAHTEAVRLVQEGDLAAAQGVVDEIRARWSGLNTQEPAPACAGDASALDGACEGEVSL